MGLLALAMMSVAGAQGTGKTVLGRLVVVGDSLSAGFQNFSLFDSNSVPGVPPGGQRHGYAALVAKQAGAPLTQPLFFYPGLPPALMLTPSGQIVRGTTPGLRENPADQAYNLSVPGFVLANALAYPFPGNPLVNGIDALSDLILATPGTVVPGCGPLPASLLPPMNPPSALGVSEMICAMALKPTTILMSVGNNDASQALTFGLPPTDPAVFASEFNTLLGALAGTGATIVIANIPDVGALPFLVPVPAFKAACPAPVPPLPAGTGNADFVVPNVVDQTRTSFDICTNYAVRPASLIAQARTAVVAYNGIIAAAAARFGAVVVDVNGLFARIEQHGYVVGGQRLTTAFLGGLFSLDGIHPTNTGYAILANETIMTMNARLHAGIPPVSVEQVAKTDPLVFPKH